MCGPQGDLPPHLFELTHGQREERDKLLLVLADAHTGDLRQALQRHVAEHGHVQELSGGRAGQGVSNTAALLVVFGQLILGIVYLKWQSGRFSC